MTLDRPTERSTLRRVPHRRAARSVLASLRLPVALAVASLGSMPGAASAGEFSVGLGAGADRGKVDCVASAPCDHRSTQWQLFADYALIDAVVLRAVYFDAGRFDGGDTTPQGTEFGGRFKVSGVGLSHAVTPTVRVGVDWDVTRFKVHTAQGPLQMLGLSAQLSF
jgi:hypothetical protein